MEAVDFIVGDDLPNERYLPLSRYENEALLDRHQSCKLGPAEGSVFICFEQIWSLFGDLECINVVLDNADVLPNQFRLLQVHCPFMDCNNLHGVSLKNEDVSTGGTEDDHQFLGHLYLIGAIVREVLKDGGLGTQDFHLRRKPVASKLGGDDLDSLLLWKESDDICVILPRGYVLNHVYTRQLSLVSLLIDICDVCQREVIKMELDRPLFEVSLWLNIEHHEILRDDAVDDPESLFGAILEEGVS